MDVTAYGIVRQYLFSSAINEAIGHTHRAQYAVPDSTRSIKIFRTWLFPNLPPRTLRTKRQWVL